MNDNDALEPSEIATKIARGKRPEGLSYFRGYIGKSDDPNTVILYVDLKFNSYITLKKEDILHAEKGKDPSSDMNCVYIWVRDTTEVTYTLTESTKQQARFIEGSISKDYSKYSKFANDIFLQTDPYIRSAIIASRCFTPFICTSQPFFCPKITFGP